MSNELALGAVEISTGPSTWLNVNDEANGFDVGVNSFSDRTLTQKQRSVGEDALWVRGAPVIASAPGNVGEPFEVWVTGTDHFDFDSKVNALVSYLTQVTFSLRRTIGNSRQTWTCFAVSDLRIQTSQAFLVATTGLVSCTVPRLPDVTLESV